MSGLIFEGTLEGLSETQVQFVTDLLENRGFTNGKVVVAPVGLKGDNYIANVLRLTAEKSDGDIFKMIAKVAPQNPMVREMMSTKIYFGNEHAMYTEILPKLTEQQEIAGIPRSERFKFPICYDSFLEAPNEIILLEDLKESDFVILDRMQSLSNDGMKLAIENLAKLHTLSYVLKHKKPETYNNFKQKLINMWTIEKRMEGLKKFNKKVEEDILTIVKEEKYKNVIIGSTSNITDITLKFSKLDAESRTSVILQGDCWTNNIMYKLENNKPTECVMIDYQISKEGNPAYDILYLILNCTDYNMRSQYYHEWVNYYHTTLDNYLTYFGLKVNHIYPRDQLDADLRRHGRLGLGLTLLLTSILIRESKDAIEFNSGKGSTEEIKDKIKDKIKSTNMNKDTLSRFKTKIEELVDSIVDFGLI